MTAGCTEEIVGVSLTELGLDPDSYFIDLGKIFNLCKPQLLNNTCLSTEKSLRTGWSWCNLGEDAAETQEVVSRGGWWRGAGVDSGRGWWASSLSSRWNRVRTTFHRKASPLSCC